LEAQVEGLMDPDFPNGVTTLDDVSWALMGQPKSSWSLAFQLRVALHIWGDLHQPLHTSDLYDRRNFLRGDRGGNNIRVDGQYLKAGEETLHAVWDSVAGFMPGSMPIQKEDLEQVAAKLIAEYPPESFIFQLKLSQAWNSNQSGQRFGMPEKIVDFVHDFVVDTHTHIPFVYDEYIRTYYPSVVYTPSYEYMLQAEEIAKQQVVLGGYRLASWLNFHAQYLPAEPCNDQPEDPWSLGGVLFGDLPPASVIMGSVLGFALGGMMISEMRT